MRNGLPESWHTAAAAIVTPQGRLVARLGDPGLSTFLRSAAKPFQVLPLLLAGGEETYGLEAADIAVMCASHTGRPEHTGRVLGLLQRGGLETRHLLCGIHPPLDREAAEELRRRGEEPTSLHNNCSGKHAGMLLACRLLGHPTKDYPDRDHPLQRSILEGLAELAGLPSQEIALGVDGCGVPAFRMPLAAAARAYAVLAHPRGGGIRNDVAEALERVGESLSRAPEMVAGPGRLTTALIQATGGRILAKEGAEGVYGLVIRGPVALGGVLKIADGSERPRDGVVLDLLRQLGVLSGEEFQRLAGFYRTKVYNRRGLEVGEIVPDVELEEI